MAGFASQLATTQGTNDRFLRMGLLPVNGSNARERTSATELDRNFPMI